MAGERIKVETSVLRQAMKKFNTCKEEMAQAYGRMATEVMALNSNWNGDASQAFMERFSELIENIRTSDATIEQAIKGLEVAAKAYEDAESDNIEFANSAPEVPPFA